MKKISLTEVEVMHLRDLYEAELEAAKKRIATLTSVLSKLGELKQTQEQIVNKLLEGTAEIAKKNEKKAIKKPGKRGRPPKVKNQVPVAEKVKESLNITEPKTKTIAPKIKAIKAKVEKPKTAKTKIVKPKIAKSKAVKPTVAKVSATKKVAKVIKDTAPKPVAKRKVKTTRKPIKKGKGTDKIKWNEFIVDAIKTTNNFIPSNELVKSAIAKFNIPSTDSKRVNSAIATTLTKLSKTDKTLVTYKKAGVRGSLYGLPEWISDSGELIPEMKEKVQA